MQAHNSKRAAPGGSGRPRPARLIDLSRDEYSGSPCTYKFTRSHEFGKVSSRILGFGVPSMPNPSSGALKSILPGPRERSSILNAHLGGQQPPTGWGGSKTTGPRGARGRQGDDSRACECGSDFRVDSDMAPIWGPYDKTRGCRQTTLTHYWSL